MKISLNTKIKTLNDEVIKDEKDKPLTFAKIFINALMGGYEDEKNLNGNDKFIRYQLAQKINRQKDKTAELTLEEARLLKEVVGKGYGALIVGQVFEVLK